MIDRVHLGAVNHRLFFRIIGEDNEVIAKSEEITVFKH